MMLQFLWQLLVIRQVISSVFPQLKPPIFYSPVEQEKIVMFFNRIVFIEKVKNVLSLATGIPAAVYVEAHYFCNNIPTTANAKCSKGCDMKYPAHTFYIDLKDSEDIVIFQLWFRQPYVAIDSFEKTGPCIPGPEYFMHRNKTWQRGRNVASFWYEQELFYFKMNNINGIFTRPCTGIRSASTIRQIVLDMETTDNVRIMISYVRK